MPHFKFPLLKIMYRWRLQYFICDSESMKKFWFIWALNLIFSLNIRLIPFLHVKIGKIYKVMRITNDERVVHMHILTKRLDLLSNTVWNQRINSFRIFWTLFISYEFYWKTLLFYQRTNNFKRLLFLYITHFGWPYNSKKIKEHSQCFAVF